MAQLKDLRSLLHHEVQAMYSAEHQITAGLTRMIEHAHSHDLLAAFTKHLHETESQIRRLEQVAKLLGIDPSDEKNPGMAGIIAEGEMVLHKDTSPHTLDAALIAGAQKVEHYEIAGYGTAVYLAHELGLTEVATILDSILDEEKTTNAVLNNLAKAQVNPMAEAE